MPIDPKQALEYLGVNPDEVESIDAFKEHVSKTYVPRSEAFKDEEIQRQIFGKVNNTMRSRLKNVAKEIGIDAKFDDIEPTDGIDLIAAGAKAKLVEYETKLSEAQKGNKPAKEVEEWQRKYDEASKKVEALTGNLTEWETKYKDLEGSVAKREREARINAQWENAFGSLKFNEGVSPLAVKGFQVAVRDKYAIDFDDEGSPYAIDVTTKKRVPNPNRAHEFLGLGDLVKQYAEQEKLIGGNPQGGKPVRQTMTMLGGSATQRQDTPTGDAPKGRRIMPPVLNQ